MTTRRIPIHAASGAGPTPLAPATPLFSGEPAQVERVLLALQAALRAETGEAPAPEYWLRELRLGREETRLVFAPGMCCGGGQPVEVVFATLRRLLPDTDIFVLRAER